MSTSSFENAPSEEPEKHVGESDEYSVFETHEVRIREIEILTDAIVASEEAEASLDSDNTLYIDWDDTSTHTHVQLERAGYRDDVAVYYLTVSPNQEALPVARFRYDDESYDVARIDENEQEYYDDFITNSFDATTFVHGYLTRCLPDTAEIISDASYEEKFWPLAACMALSDKAIAAMIFESTANDSEVDQNLIDIITARIISADTTTVATNLDKQELQDILKIPEPERGDALDGLTLTILSRGYDVADPEYVTDAIIGLMHNEDYFIRYGTPESGNASI